jgi:hypothetical protein
MLERNTASRSTRGSKRWRLTSRSHWVLSMSLSLASGLMACSDDAGHDDDVHPADEDAGGNRDARVREAGITTPDAKVDPPPKDAATVGKDADVEAPPDAGPCKEFVLPSDCNAAAPNSLPTELRCTGLYGDFATQTVACGVDEYRPAYELWSDGAVKRRFVALPAGQKINASEPNEFSYPVGTKFWKEFRLQTANGLKLAETRLLYKAAQGWQFTTYVWSEDNTSAKRVDKGVGNVFGTGFDVPTSEHCQECHRGRKDFVLGWDWLMLGPGASGMTRDALLASGRVEGPTVAADSQAAIPGNDVERAALGYLHANCGISCHNRSNGAIAKDIGFYTRLDLATLTAVQSTDAVKTGINRAPNWWSASFIWGAAPAGGFYDLRPGDPERSYALARMGVRGGDRQMPRIGSNEIDDLGVEVISAWVRAMTTAGGYPAPSP